MDYFDPPDDEMEILEPTYRFRFVRPVDMVPADIQREHGVSRKHVNEIKSAFDFDLLGIPRLLDLNTGLYGVMDGMHRKTALEELGFGTVGILCQVFAALPTEQQALQFNVNYQQKRISATDNLRSLKDAKKAWAKEIYEAVEAAGYSIGTTKRGGSIKAVSTLQRIYEEDGHAERLRRVLELCAEGFSVGHSPGAPILNGLAKFDRAYRGDYNRSAVVQILRALGERGLLAEAEELSKGPKQDGGWVAVALVDAYNFRKRNRLDRERVRPKRDPLRGKLRLRP